MIDSVTREFLGNVLVDFDGRPAQADVTDADGDFATGIYEEGAYAVRFERAGYVTKEVVAVMTRGDVNYQIIELAPVKANTFNVRAVTPDGTDIPDPVVQIDYLGRFGNENAYNITVGKWGYRTRLLADTSFLEETAVELLVELEPGYADDFVLDLGWETVSTASSGAWERGEPIGTELNGVPAQLDTDVLTDLGNAAYVTGLGGGAAGENDVDGGVVTLNSPVFDLTGTENALITFQYHFFNAGGSTAPDDELVVSLTNGSSTIELMRVNASTSDWTTFTSDPLAGQIAFTDAMRLTVATSDLAATGHIVEAMFDDFEVVPSSQPELLISEAFGCAPLTVTYSVAPSVGSVDFLLIGADRTSVSGTSATVAYSTPGNYSVALVTGPSSMRDTFLYTNVVRVDAAPAAAFSAAPIDLSVNFINQSTNAASYSWNFGDGDTSTDLNPVHSYDQPGTYDVTLVAVAACGNDTTTQSVTVISTGVREFAAASGITVLGNPASDAIQVLYTGDREIELVVSDLLGRRLLSQKLEGPGTYRLPVATLPAGAYLLSSPQVPNQGVPVSVVH